MWKVILQQQKNVAHRFKKTLINLIIGFIYDKADHSVIGFIINRFNHSGESLNEDYILALLTH